MSERTISQISRMISTDFQVLFNSDKLSNEIDCAIIEVKKIHKKEEERKCILEKELFLLKKEYKKISLLNSSSQVKFQEKRDFFNGHLDQININISKLEKFIHILKSKKNKLL